ncbi:MAG: SufS family cysteine desulfurase [Candidatus Eremiobacterota bacterium]
MISTSLRQDFPLLAERPELVYLDSAATSLKPRVVLEAEQAYYRECCANIHRGLYRMSEEATRRYDEARDEVARWIGASDPATCLFTSGTTDAINLVAYTWGEQNVKAGDAIVLTGLEHHSNLVPWQQLALRKGATLRWIEVRPDGTLDLSDLDRLLDGARLLTFTWVSNVFGTINPVVELCRRAREAGARVLVDGAQGVPHLPCRVEELGCDFLAFSGHKMLAPTGTGVLWGHRELLEGMPPFRFGGDMILEVWRDRCTWNELPYKFEAGTPNIAGVFGLGAAARYLTAVGMDRVRAHERSLLAYARERLGALEGFRMIGPSDPEQQSGVFSFEFRGLHPHDLATLLDRENLCIRAGHHCCQPLMRKIGMSGTARASLHVYSEPADLDRLAEALERSSSVFRGVLF